jgi:ABC-type nitrate/sulfonate/bicarbonate transport system permease component
VTTDAPRSSALAAFGLGVLRLVVPIFLAAGVVVLLWVAALKAFDINPLIGKRPEDVWRYMLTDADAGEHRDKIFASLRITLKDASIGFVAGLTAGLLVAMSFVLSRGVEQALMPVALLLRSVPLVAMTPVIVLVFGRGTGGVAVICGIVVFFPALVNITFGIRAASPQAMDLVAAYGGSRLTAMRKVALPSALPALFASARISVPGSLIGALLAEWLATGKGIGSDLLKSTGGFRYTELWSEVVVITGTSILLYALVGVLETAVLSRYGTSAGRSR